MRDRLLFLNVLALIVIAVGYDLGLQYDFFFIFWWWDTVMHILGGLWVALCVAWLGTFFGASPSLLECVLAALTVGIGWEIFEYVLGLTDPVFMPYWVDTIKDLINDVIGGVIAGFLLPKKGRRILSKRKH